MKLIAIALMSLACIPAWTAETAESTTPDAVNNVAALHAKVITPASNALFQAESTPPSTAQAWQKIRASAADLQQAAVQLTAKELAKDQGQWLEFAQALQKQAHQAVIAAENKDQDALVIANGGVISVCEDCHTRYRDAGRSMQQ
jgi:hypothetical protein